MKQSFNQWYIHNVLDKYGRPYDRIGDLLERRRKKSYRDCWESSRRSQ